MTNPQRILVVDDDRALATVLRAALEDEGFEVLLAHDGLAGLRRFEADRPDFVVLDVLMPEMDGLEVCRRIRRTSRVPIVLLTSRAEEVDRINGLDTGADDYVTKPFSTRELCARLRAIARRTAPVAAAGPSVETTGPLRIGALELDAARFEVRWQGRAVTLTKAEFDLLAALAKHAGFVLGRDRLLDLARGDGVVVTDRTVDTYVKRLRRKLSEVDPAFDALETVIGVGYRWRAGA